jgi:hypothetical protein
VLDDLYTGVMYFRSVLVAIALLGQFGTLNGRIEEHDDASSNNVDRRHPKDDRLTLELWSRGAFDFDTTDLASMAMQRMNPVSYVRRDVLQNRDDPNCEMNGYCALGNRFRGGSQDLTTSSLTDQERIQKKIQDLGQQFGQEFLDAIERNKREHAEDCKLSCELYFCASPNTPIIPLDQLLDQTSMKSYSMGPVPPEDFAESFG